MTAGSAEAASASFAPETEARTQTLLRFAAGTTGAFIVCEGMGWYPSFLAPLLAGVLLANLPTALPIKAGAISRAMTWSEATPPCIGEASPRPILPSAWMATTAVAECEARTASGGRAVWLLDDA